MLSTVPTLPPIIALAIRPLPLMPLQPLLALLVQRIKQHHPGIFERLDCHAEKRFGIDPTDLPFAFVLEPQRLRPRLFAVRTLPTDLDVRIGGSFACLTGLIDGDLDGDALFFSRDVVIEGDIEAVLALRNAIDDAQVDMLGEALGPLSQWKGPVRRILEEIVRVLSLFDRIATRA